MISTKFLAAAVIVAAGLLSTACESSGERQDRHNAERVDTSTTTMPAAEPATPVPTESMGDQGASAEDHPGWDADSQGNQRFDPDTFDPATDGNGTDDGGTPVNGTEGTYHDGLPCYLDFPEFDTLTAEQRNRAHARYCEA